MATNLADARKRFARYVYRPKHMLDHTLDSAKLETRCPLDNGRHDCTPISTAFTPNQLDKLPVELLVEFLLLLDWLDIPSITRFRSVNRRSMAIVNSVRQYSTIIKHCPNIIRAIVSLQADSYDCHTLYTTLSTSECSSPTCTRFGNYRYLISCRRVCYLCFTQRLEYFPLTTHDVSKALITSPYNMSAGRFLKLANAPSILSLPGSYGLNSKYRKKGIRLHDRETIVQNLSGIALPNPRSDKQITETKRFMAIISAPLLLDAGRLVDWGYFCLGCRNEHNNRHWNTNGNHFRRKYMTEGMTEHIARFGRVKEVEDPIPGMHMHSPYIHVSGT